ncbi:hypothetical protein JZ751_003875 [Albula glossodonta]|uniref:Uncharacterized protein n=1 Tax=Albula glossodonta TaxID=121402 RepID=A0A8T2P6E4_9TELE|nr:hypothetical protein JZ751_003875 [Albula glossodonta]
MQHRERETLLSGSTGHAGEEKGAAELKKWCRSENCSSEKVTFRVSYCRRQGLCAPAGVTGRSERGWMLIKASVSLRFLLQEQYGQLEGGRSK